MSFDEKNSIWPLPDISNVDPESLKMVTFEANVGQNFIFLHPNTILMMMMTIWWSKATRLLEFNRCRPQGEPEKCVPSFPSAKFGFFQMLVRRLWEGP